MPAPSRLRSIHLREPGASAVIYVAWQKAVSPSKACRALVCRAATALFGKPESFTKRRMGSPAMVKPSRSPQGPAGRTVRPVSETVAAAFYD
jgi:formate-dependent phosphoribosylglycinamide formyltransferase (GAR transformylase)